MLGKKSQRTNALSERMWERTMRVASVLVISLNSTDHKPDPGNTEATHTDSDF